MTDSPIEEQLLTTWKGFSEICLYLRISRGKSAQLVSGGAF